MKKTFVVAAVAALVAGSNAWGAGYRIPEQSVNSLAKAGANIASADTADASYFNPANMGWLEDRGYLEVDLQWIHLKSVTYTDNRTSLYNGESESEDYLLPTFFAVSPDYNNFRVGLSFTYPGGLSKEWPQLYPATFAREFTLKTYEMNGSLSYTFNDVVSVAAGLRAVYADAKVKSAGQVAPGVTAGRDMDGDTWEWGYNLALSVRPVKALNLSATYRSKVDLDLEGDADLFTSAGPSTYIGPGSVSIPLPAVLSLSAAYTFADQFTVELEWDRTYWSDYETLDFTYPTSLGNPVLTSAFDLPKAKNWDDSDSYRIGLSWAVNDTFTLMAGFAIDENPIPDSTLGFDLPDSDALIYSAGMRYRVNEAMDLGIGYLYTDKDDRSVVNSMVNGEFTDSGAHLVAVGLSYKL